MTTAGVTEAFFKLPDGNMHCFMQGTGFPVMLLHSMGVSARSWLKVIGALSQGFTAYALDMLGHGDSDKPPRDYTLGDHARNVLSFMDARGHQGAYIVGNSVGAMLAVDIASTFPQRVAKLVLVGCPGWETAEERQQAKAATMARYAGGDAPRTRTLEDLATTYANPTQDLLDMVNADAAKVGIWGRKTSEVLYDYDLASRFPLIQSPTLIVYGERDHLLEKEQFLLRQIPGSRSVVLPNAGHVPQLDNPEAFAQVVVGFLKS